VQTTSKSNKKLSKKGSLITMSKLKALTLTIICAIAAVALFTQQDYTQMWAFLAGTVLFGSIWAYKDWRDFNIVSQARQEKVETPKVSAIPMTSKGSHRLFVPPPINDQYRKG
jgi:hypothetical protein